MDNLGDILAGKKLSVPPEIAAIKKYVREEFAADVTIKVQNKQIVIAAPSSALAATLRMNSPELMKLCKTDKKLVFRVGS